MNKLGAVAIWLLFSFAGLQLWGQDQSLRVNVKLTQPLVKSDETFRVETVIRNAGTSEQQIPVFTCSWFGQWMVDNPDVYVNSHNCLQNIRIEKKLKPGETYENSLVLHVLPNTNFSRRRVVTFHLGFDTTGYFGARKPDVKYPAIWSNGVSVTVTSD